MKFNDPSPEDGKVLSRRNLHSKSDQNVLASIKSSKNSPRHSNHSPLKPLDNEYEIIQTIHPRYKTRTCSAGTLIISEESFNKPNRRKRPQRKNTSADMTSAKITASKEQLCEDADLQKNKWQRRRSTLTSSTPISYRISFPPTDEDTSIRSLVPHARQKSDPLPYEAYVESTSTGRFRQNDSFQRGLCERSVSKTGPSRVTPSDKDATLSQQQQHRKKKRRKVQRRRCHSDGSTSSDNAEWRNGDVGETSATKGWLNYCTVSLALIDISTALIKYRFSEVET
ncbi:hypothetical protein HHI36_013005 [Cryptolaemus montrouzieri]|uniref:Uncharacterized protein n=1 Tax=Cryptolaemus montrouzieri TaxID=559131 RepID=A0ABD2NGF3_9CUCU